MEQSLKQCRWQWVRSAMVAACVVLLVAVGAQSVLAQQTASPRLAATAPPVAAQTATAKPAASKQAAEGGETAAPSKPDAEGIKLHGHWLLQARNADGTPGERREFENSLVTTYITASGAPATMSGSALLVAALAGNIALSYPSVGLVSGNLSGDPSQWCTFSPATAVTGIQCFAFSTTNSLYSRSTGYYGGPINQNNPGLIYNETGLTVSASYTPTASLVLTGNFTVPSGLTSISAVQSLFDGCVPAASPAYNGTYFLTGSDTDSNATISPNACTASIAGFTQALIYTPLTSTPVANSNGVATPLAVTAGQIITVTFTLSFS